MTDLQKCLVDVLIEFFKSKSLNNWAYVSLREIENFLRDSNDVPAFSLETVPEDLFYIWVGELIYDVLENIAHWPEKSKNWDELSKVARIKEAQNILSKMPGPKVELIELEEQGIIAFNWIAPVSAPIQNSLALFVREVLRRELGKPDLEIILES